MSRRRRFLVATGAAAGMAALGLRSSPASAQPLKSARIVVGFPPGGSNDVIARLLADKLRGVYAETLIVENRAGAGGRIGVEVVRNAAPDGSVILQTPGTILTMYPHLYRSLGYDALRDFRPVSPICTFDIALAVGPETTARTVGELVQWFKANPQRASFGSPAPGASPHFVGLMFAQAAGLNLVHVGYKGAAPAVQDLLGGQIPAYFGTLADVAPYLDSGRLRVLATSGPTRAGLTPGSPTFVEAGYRSVQVQEWYGMLLPTSAPPAAVTALNEALRDALRDSDVIARLKTLNVDPAPMNPSDFAERIRNEQAAWAPVVRASGFKPEG